MPEILLINLPHDCTQSELQDWVKAHGIKANSIRMVSDLEAGTAPAFAHVEVRNAAQANSGAELLNGRTLRNHTVIAKLLA